jgi:branched-chain amino acid transport system ATP-binding protein
MSRFAASIESAGYGPLMVLGKIALAVESGQMLVILGSNGAGKTTTLHAIAGSIVNVGRRVMLGDVDLSKTPTWMLAGMGVSLVPDGARCFPNLTVLDNLRGAKEAGRGRRRLPEESILLDEVFSYFPFLENRLSSIAGTLSGGQRQMLAIGRALMTRPEALLLDEPSAGLAPKIVEDLFESLSVIKIKSGCAIVMAEQNVGYATQIADTCIVLEEGQVVISGMMNEVVKHEKLRTAYLGL